MDDGHNYIGHNYIGHNYMGHDYIGHNYIGMDDGAAYRPAEPHQRPLNRERLDGPSVFSFPTSWRTPTGERRRPCADLKGCLETRPAET